MSKKKWISCAVIAVCGVIVLSLFYVVFHRVTGQSLPWWAYAIAAVIYGLVVYLVYLLAQGHAQKFDNLLLRENFHTDKRYEADGQILCIDFQNKRIANTYLSTKTFVDFKDIVGCRVESYQRGSKIVLEEDERFLDVVITVNKEEPTPDHPFLYIAMFEVKIAAADVPETPDVTEELVAKYSELKPLYDLKRDISEIVLINKQDATK